MNSGRKQNVPIGLSDGKWSAQMALARLELDSYVLMYRLTRTYNENISWVKLATGAAHKIRGLQANDIIVDME
jgi:hypothetical protein